MKPVSVVTHSTEVQVNLFETDDYVFAAVILSDKRNEKKIIKELPRYGMKVFDFLAASTLSFMFISSYQFYFHLMKCKRRDRDIISLSNFLIIFLTCKCTTLVMPLKPFTKR